MKRIVLKVLLILAGIALIAVLPHILPLIHINIITEIAFFSLFAVSFNMLFGYAGLLSFGHAAYFGIGAYTMALLFKHVSGLPLLLSLLLGGVGGGLGGLLVGYFCVRLKGAYFALLTLAFNQFFFAIALKWRSVTSGDDGMGITRPDLHLPGLGAVDMYELANVYYLIVAVVILCLLLLWYLTKTPFGNTIKAVKLNDERADFLGYNVFLAKLILFGIAGFFAGIAGGLFALFAEFVSTGSIDLARSTEVIFMAFIGGTGSFLGPVLGSTIYMYFTDWLSDVTARWEFILGVIFVLIVLYAPKGLLGVLRLEQLGAAIWSGTKTR